VYVRAHIKFVMQINYLHISTTIQVKCNASMFKQMKLTFLIYLHTEQTLSMYKVLYMSDKFRIT